MQLSVFFFNYDAFMGYVALLLYFFIWLAITSIYFEIRKSVKQETIPMSQATGVETINVPYNTMPWPSLPTEKLKDK